MDIGLAHSLIFFLTGGFLVFLAITVVRDNLANMTNRATGVLLLFAGLGPLMLALGYLFETTGGGTAPAPESAVYNLYHFWEFFFPSLVVFAWLFPIDRLRFFRHPRLRYFIVLPQFLHLALALLHKQLVDLCNLVIESAEAPGLKGDLAGMFDWLFAQILLFLVFIRDNDAVIFGSINLLYVAVAVYFLEVGRRFVKNPRMVLQTRLVIRGVRIGLAAYVAAFLTWTYWNSPNAEMTGAYLALAAVVGGGGFIAYAIIRHQFLNVRLVFRQSLIHTLISAILVGLYLVLATQSHSMLEPLFGASAEVVSYLVIILLLLLFQPISAALDNFIRSMFMRTRTDYRNIIERFSRDVISLFDPVKLRTSIEETLKTSILVEKVYFVLYDDTIQEYAMLKSEDLDRRVVVDRDDLMLRGINLLDSPSRMSALTDYEEGSKLAELLNDLRTRVILPLKDAQHMLGFIALTSKAAGYRYTSEDLNLLGVLSNQMVTALTNARLYADSLERTRLEEEVNMARQIQLDLLPSNPPVCRGSVISANSTPSRTVGGDFYDFIAIKEGNRLALVIADASGKGMPAALMVAQIQAIIRSEVNNGNQIERLLMNLNNQIATSSSSEKYVTLFYAELDIEAGILHYANAGHNYPVLVRQNGTIERLIVGGPVIGAFPDIQFESAKIQLEREDLLFFFTDGLSEAMNAEGVEYGEDRIERFVTDKRTLTPEQLIIEILNDVRLHDPTFPPQDDTTIVSLKMIDNIELDEKQTP